MGHLNCEYSPKKDSAKLAKDPATNWDFKNNIIAKTNITSGVTACGEHFRVI